MTRAGIWIARTPAPGGAWTAVVVEGPVAGDRRVERVIARETGGVVVVDVGAHNESSLLGAADNVRAAWLLLAGLKDWRSRGRVLERALGSEAPSPPYAGILACFRQTRRAVHGARLLRRVARRYAPARVHANDLTAGLSLALAQPTEADTRIYDAHELEVHRQRKVGWLRLLVEHGHEGRAVAAATEVRTVCQPIAERLQALYPGLECTVHTNDLFEHRPHQPAPSVVSPALVYVGRGVKGRKLELLDGDAEQLGFSVHVWLARRTDCGGLPSAEWNFGCSSDYESELLELTRSRRSLMWCCLETKSLSYRLALPNKFFQALAACIPIVASPGTYLAQLVERHGLGVVSDGHDLPALGARVQTDEYAHWVDNVLSFRSQLRSGAIKL